MLRLLCLICVLTGSLFAVTLFYGRDLPVAEAATGTAITDAEAQARLTPRQAAVARSAAATRDAGTDTRDGTPDTARRGDLPAAVRRIAQTPVNTMLHPVILAAPQNAAPAHNVAMVMTAAAVVTAPDAGFHRITVASANVRGGPSTADSVLGRMVQGDEFTVTEDPGNGWLRIRVEGDGVEGWIAARLTNY